MHDAIVWSMHMWEKLIKACVQNHLISYRRRHAVQRISPAKGQGSGASRWPEGVKVDLPAGTSVGGPESLCSKDPSITVTYLPCVDLCWPQGSSLPFLSSLFTPNQSQIRASLHDKVLWKTRAEKRKRFLSVADGEQILSPQGGMVTWF